MTNPLCDPYLILEKVYKNGKFLKQAIAETPVEPLNKPRTVKIVYGVLEKDIYLSAIISANAEKPPKSSVKIVLKIALYMLEFMDKKSYMVVDNAVELIKKLGKDGAAGFVNSFLRSYKLPPEPKSIDEKLSLNCSVPLWLVKKVRRSFKGEAEEILNAKSQGVCVRFEKCPEKFLDKEHIDTPFKNVYIFKNFVRDEGFDSGDYTFQSVGSVAICNIVEPCESFLDSCAAPGGKSVLISKKCKEVFSSDIHEHRVELIKAYAKRMGVENITAFQGDSAEYNESLFERFDGVLCDVPCSGTGVISENPDIMLNRKEEDIVSLSALQLKILSNCAKYVKKGGSLYYSTCSYLPEENDSVIYSFLENNEDFELEIPSSPLAHKTTKFGLQYLPNISLGAGFYITRLKRK